MKTTLESPEAVRRTPATPDLVEMIEMDHLPALAKVPLPPSVRFLAILLLSGVIVLAVAMIWVPWQQSVSGDGRVVAYTPAERQQIVAAPVEGRLLKTFVIEGTRVKQGDPLFEVTDNDPTILDNLRRDQNAVEDRLKAAEARVDSFRGQILGLEGSRRNALESAALRIQAAGERVAAADRFIEAAESNLLTAQLNLERTKTLAQKGLRSTRDLELAQNTFDRDTAEFARSKNSLNEAKKNLEALEAERQRIENDFKSSIESARAALNSAQADVANIRSTQVQLQIRINRQRTQDVVSPRDGTVFRVLAQPGSELLKSGDPVVIIVPETDAQTVELWVKGNDMPLIQQGDKVRLQFDGWPAIQFVGWPSVAVGTFGGLVKLVDPTDDGKGRFRILVGPDPADEAWPKSRLRQGVRANGWVLLKIVPLGFEMWRQFNGFPPSLDQPPAEDKGSKKK